MNRSFFFTPFSPVVILFMATFFLLAEKASCTDPQFLACEPKSCGDQNINFPFHIQNAQEEYCGYPGFAISCNEKNKAVLSLSNNEYIIQEIYYQNHSLRLSNAVGFGKNTSCSPQIQNISLNGDRFRQSTTRTGLFLFYNCNSALLGNDSELLKHKVDCSGESANVSTVAMLDDDPLLGSASEKCGAGVVAPVDVYRGENVSIGKMLERGFVLNWVANNCSECDESGGRCGFNYTTYQFKCFCPDRPHARSCISEYNPVTLQPTGEGNRQIKMVIQQENKKLGLKLGLGFGVGCLIAGMILLSWIYGYHFRKRRDSSSFRLKNWQHADNVETFMMNYHSLTPKRFSYSDIKKITNSFVYTLGHGGFGNVYRGKLPNGRLVAVKVLKDTEGDGEDFMNEVASISRTSHVNVVTLLGFCYERNKRALIYEFMPNGSLDSFILYKRSPNTNRRLEWKKLYEIAVGIARGLEYLHRGCNTPIVHFDIKPHNILLDEDFRPKISDFGLAKLCKSKVSKISMIGVRGTVGYIAPEVFCRSFGGVTYKSDVYSYGMMVLEMVGQSKDFDMGSLETNEMYFPDWFYMNLEPGKISTLHGDRTDEEEEIVKKMIITGLWCIQNIPSHRPSMTKVVEMFEGSLQSLQIPPRPSLSSPRRVQSRDAQAYREGNRQVKMVIQQENNKLGLKLGLGFGVGCLFAGMILLSYIYGYHFRKRRDSSNLLSMNSSSDPSSKADLEGDGVYLSIPIFSYTELGQATNNFDSEKELGDGGFGTVYYGKLKDGREVAVKRLYEHNYKRVKQFMNEVEILTRLHHKNLVCLYGCTSRRSRELLLVYEYIPNGTVADHLHGDLAKSSPLTWPIRMSIAIETACALAYLHASDIIHRDVKTNNILLDTNFSVKVADFGLSRLFPSDATHVSTVPQGTPGYVDPEYHQSYQLTDKSDVYSFGVVLIELISSMPAVDITRHRHEINLSNLAIIKIQKCAFDELIDSGLGYNSDEEVKRMTTSVAELAFQCLHHDKEMRPSMENVLHQLKIIQCGEESLDNLEEVHDDNNRSTNTLPPPSPPYCDEAVLLKNILPPPSPVSVTAKWASSSSATPNEIV
uniref:non-specific serine/threonine protein kinase n=1 Tax=Salix viminalis TaxID=40686 RepID=A0A6N2N0H0_SALVM